MRDMSQKDPEYYGTFDQSRLSKRYLRNHTISNSREAVSRTLTAQDVHYEESQPLDSYITTKNHDRNLY